MVILIGILSNAGVAGGTIQRQTVTETAEPREILSKYVTRPCHIADTKSEKMLKVIRNFNRTDCIYYKLHSQIGCCGRSESRGVCKIPDGNEKVRLKTCSRNQPYCKYQKKEEENVHT